jgi:hypothetical protein
MSKWARERRERVEGAFIPLTQKGVVTALRPRISGKPQKLREVRRLREKTGNSDLPRSAPKKLTS